MKELPFFISSKQHITMAEFESLYDRLGDQNLQILIDRFYDFVFADQRILHLFKNDQQEIKDKQYLFLTQFLGGPARYTEVHGHPKMRFRHLPHKITKDAALAWLEDMAKAVNSLDIEDSLKDELFNRFPPVASHMVNS